MTVHIRLTHCVDYPSVSPKDDFSIPFSSFTPINQRKRKASSPPNFRERLLQSASPVGIKTETEVTERSASSPPEYSSTTIPRSEITSLASKIQEATVTQGDQRTSLPPASTKDPIVSQQAAQAGQANSSDDVKAKILYAFAEAGVPTDMTTDDMGAKIAHAVAKAFEGVVTFANDVQNHTSAHISHVQVQSERLEAHNNQLAAQNQRLEEALRACDKERQRLEDEFYKFQKRSSQREIMAQLKQVEGQIDKLRCPDVTLERLEKTLSMFEAQLKTLEVRIDSFKGDCVKELTKLSDARRGFNRDSKAYKANRKNDLQDFKGEITAIKETIDEAYDKWEEIDTGMDRLTHSHAKFAASIEQEVKVLRQHLHEVAQDEEQEKVNTAFSACVRELKDKQFNNQADIEEKIQGLKDRMNESIADFTVRLASVEEKLKKARQAFD